jgi:hypothetical protein
MHGPTCIFWANLKPFSLKLHRQMLANPGWALRLPNGSRCLMFGDSGPATRVRRMSSWPRSWANFSLL